MSNINRTLSYTYGNVTVETTLPCTKSEYTVKRQGLLIARKYDQYPIIISCDLSCDDDMYPTYYLKSSHATWPPIARTHNLTDIYNWYIPDYNITVRQMRELLVNVTPLVAALKHYTHFRHHDDSKLVNAAHAINACIIRHMAANATVKGTSNVR